MGITMIPTLIYENPSQIAAATTATIGALRKEGRHYRHPDSALISYPLVVEKPLGCCALEKPLKIAVIGSGVAGIAAIYELSRLPDADKTISVTLYESDPDHFAISSPMDTGKKRAGRVFAQESSGPQSKHAVYEMGAMRFPEIAGLTWHYASQVFNDSDVVQAFPNPGKVPTEFVQGERVERFMGNQWLDPNSPTLKAIQVVSHGLIGTKCPDINISMFRIGGCDPAKITEELKSPNTKPERLAEIREDWKIFADKYNDLTLESAVRKVISARCPELPDVQGLQQSKDNSAKINYYVELFGRYGFGTAGFKPVYNTSLTEMMRLKLWQYSNEYSLPVDENVQFITKLYYKAAPEKDPLNPGKPKMREMNVELARVCDVCHLDEVGGTSAAVLFYRIDSQGKEDPIAQMKQFDYVIMAVTPKQASSICNRAGFENRTRQVLLGDYGRQFKSPLNVRPPFVLSTEPGADAANSQIPRAINQIHMINSAMVFATIKKSEYDSLAPDFKEHGKIKAVISDCGLSSAFVVPSASKPDCYSLLISCAWEDDTKNLQNELKMSPKNVGDQTAESRSILNRIINRTMRDVMHPVDQTSTREKPQYKRWWLGEALSKADSKGELTDAMCFDWTTHHTSGGFKLDATGDHFNSNLLFRYHTHARQAETLQNRFFLANCSYSHLGGCIEGAFMSAVNAVCGLIVAANKGQVEKLSEEARKVITTLDRVV